MGLKRYLDSIKDLIFPLMQILVNPVWGFGMMPLGVTCHEITSGALDGLKGRINAAIVETTWLPPWYAVN